LPVCRRRIGANLYHLGNPRPDASAFLVSEFFQKDVQFFP